MNNITHGNFNVRQTDDGNLLIEGYALKFDKWTTLFENEHYEIREMIKRGALDDSAFKNTVYNKNHKDDLIFARTSNGSLQCNIDNTGVNIVAKLLNTASGRDHYQEVKSRLLDKMSFRWKQKNEKSSQTKQKRADGKIVISRVIEKITAIDDVSAVVFPAYEDTEIFARAKTEITKMDNPEEEEKKKVMAEIEALNSKFEQLTKNL